MYAPQTRPSVRPKSITNTITSRSSKRIPTARRSTSNRRVASGPTSEHTLIVLRRDDITLVAQAYFAVTRDTLDAARVGDRGAIVTDKDLMHQQWRGT